MGSLSRPGYYTLVLKELPFSTINALFTERGWRLAIAFFDSLQRSTRATEGDERRKHGHSKSDFCEPRFDTVHRQELLPAKPYLEDFNGLPFPCLGWMFVHGFIRKAAGDDGKWNERPMAART